MASKRRSLSLLALAFAAPVAAFAACSSNPEVTTSDATGSSTGSKMSGSGGSGGKSSGTMSNASSGKGGGIFASSTGSSAGGGCQSSSDCKNGDVCIGGACCESANACDTACCAGGSVCLAGSCVVPGKPCHSASDCGDGEYCETALGDGDAGAGGSGGGSVTDGGLPSDGGLCTQPAPIGGKCLPLPPTCAGDAGTTPDGGVCFADCEYHPPIGATLTPKVKWNWTTANVNPNDVDVWATPTVGRVYDSNCDGKVDELDTPNIVFVSGNTSTVNCNSGSNPDPQACHDGTLRMLDGRTGTEIWSLPSAGMVPGTMTPSKGFMVGLSVAIGDVDGDGFMDVVAMTGEGYIVVVDRNGNVKYTSDKPYGTVNTSVGWGGGLSIADMDGDGWPEIAYADTVWTMKGGALAQLFVGGKGTAGGTDEALSLFSDVDLDGKLELVAGNTAYKVDGSVLWQNKTVTNGFPGVGDFNKDGKPEVVVVNGGNVWILNGVDGSIASGPFALPMGVHKNGNGGPPTIADFDGDGYPEIGVASSDFYTVIKPTITNGAIAGMTQLWAAGNHDFSSSVTGSTVFDFDGDGVAEVVYADECWLWVFDGPTGKVRMAVSHSSFTATEASIVADIDGDGHAEMLIPSQGVDMNTWNCIGYEQGAQNINGYYWTPGPQPNSSYRGLLAIGDSADSWVGTRTLWNEHTYHVSNICDDRDDACGAPDVYGSIPKQETENWTLPWLNNFRQNVQDHGIFDAPDAVVSIAVECSDPVQVTVSVRNIGLASLPAGVDVGIYKQTSMGDVQVATTATTHSLYPGQTEQIQVTVDKSKAGKGDTFLAKILVDPNNPTFHECRSDNDDSDPVKAMCVQ